MRWTRGPPGQISRTCFKIHLSELIAAVDLASYNGGDHSRSVDSSTYHDRWIEIQWMIKRYDSSLKTRGLTSALHRRSNALNFIVTIQSTGVSSRPLIAMSPLDQLSRPICPLNSFFFANGSFALEFLGNLNCLDTQFECHLISSCS